MAGLGREGINRDADAVVTAEGERGMRVNASATAGPLRRVIASEAKQSIERRALFGMDCFVATLLAMTAVAQPHIIL